MTNQEIRKYRVAMKEERLRRCKPNRRLIRWWKRKEVNESDIPPIDWIWTDTVRWVYMTSFFDV